MIKANQKIQEGKIKIKNAIGTFQTENNLPNFVIEMILQDVLIELKELRMNEMLLECGENNNAKDGE